ncbi:MAG: oxaloacetate decarboxylase [Bacteroidales bacterium]|jgi:oxaloacetate decarboxylase gamma subunit|nr:oxaloacetate decarboxylase [Bacteroidales bacterium]
MTDIKTGLLLFTVGFPTVFLMLSLIILFGKGLILFVNKYIPDTEAKPNSPQIPSDKISVIINAVSKVTGGKGKVIKIEKIK